MEFVAGLRIRVTRDEQNLQVWLNRTQVNTKNLSVLVYFSASDLKRRAILVILDVHRLEKVSLKFIQGIMTTHRNQLPRFRFLFQDPVLDEVPGLLVWGQYIIFLPESSSTCDVGDLDEISLGYREMKQSDHT